MNKKTISNDKDCAIDLDKVFMNTFPQFHLKRLNQMQMSFLIYSSVPSTINISLKIISK